MTRPLLSFVRKCRSEERHFRGYTLLEMVIVLAVGGLLASGLTALLLAVLNVPVRIGADYLAQQDIRHAVYWLTTDLNSSRSFTAGSSPEYGTFRWFELSGSNPVSVEVTYRYDPDRRAVVRQVRRDTVLASSDDVARHVDAYGDLSLLFTPSSWAYNDVSKTWVYTEALGTAALTSREWAGPLPPTSVESGAYTGNSRVVSDRTVPFPGNAPPPPPGANRVDHRVSATPTLLQGSGPSGGADELTFTDSRFYSVNSTTGGTRTVTWEVTSQDINYTGLDAITVSIVAQSTDAPALFEIFIYNPADPEHTQGGYSPTADIAEAFGIANSNRTFSIYLGETDLSYVSSLSPRKVRLKVRATHNKNHTLRTDQVTFRVNGTPAGGFQWDYLLDSDPTVVTGSYVSGGYYFLTLDDTSYHTIGGTGSPQVAAADLTTQRIYLSTVSAASVNFIGRATRSGTTVQFFIFNPANGGDGYSTTPDATATYTSANTDYTTAFALKAADVTYINGLSLKDISMRVRATNTGGSFNLAMDRVYFRVTK